MLIVVVVRELLRSASWGLNVAVYFVHVPDLAGGGDGTESPMQVSNGYTYYAGVGAEAAVLDTS